MTQRAVNNAMVLYELGITSEELQTAREITEKVPALLNVLRSPLVTSEKKQEVLPVPLQKGDKARPPEGESSPWPSAAPSPHNF